MSAQFAELFKENASGTLGAEIARMAKHRCTEKGKICEPIIHNQMVYAENLS